MRSIGASEACWRLFQFDITQRYPPVQALRIHLENEQFVLFEEAQALETANLGAKATELTAFFSYNAEHPETKIRYVDFPKMLTWNQSQSKWNQRKRDTGTIGRIHTVHPSNGDVFYLRILLHHNHCKGAQSFIDIRTFDGVPYNSYKEICAELGLLKDDAEWHNVLSEAELTKMPNQIRALYITILLLCESKDANQLLQLHVSNWSDDYRRHFPNASVEQLRIWTILGIEHRLVQRGKQLSSFNIPDITSAQRSEVSEMLNDSPSTESVAMQEEYNFNIEETCLFKNQRLLLLTPSQEAVHSIVLNAVKNDQRLALFIDARGGTGKTFVLNTLLASTRSLNNQKNVAIAVASSGIAATLLSLGRTFHSRFKVPLNCDKDMTFCIKPSDVNAEVIKLAKLIVCDEAPMTHRYLLEGLDRLLRDIMENKLPFGGKVMVLARDFRQIIPRATRAQITDASIKKSNLWNHFKVMQLTENMLVDQDESKQHFDKWLQNVGDGKVTVTVKPDTIKLSNISIINIDDQTQHSLFNSITNLVNAVFPDLSFQANLPSSSWINWVSERAILAPRNTEVILINQVILDLFPGETTTAFSADSTKDPNDSTRFPVEFLNSLITSGLPPHQLYIKRGTVLILLRNINPKEGLCNGTRLIVENVSRFLLQCKIASGERAEYTVLIPRIEITPSNTDIPIQWSRRQFPVRPAFAMTINKSQGQTLQNVGFWLRQPSFSHGQLYVACSRVGNPDSLHFALPTREEDQTRNVVYKEALI